MRVRLSSMLLIIVLLIYFIGVGLVYSKSADFDVSVKVVENKIAKDGAEDNSFSNGAGNTGYEEGSLNTLVRNKGIGESSQRGFVEFANSQLASLKLDNPYFFPIALIVLVILIIAGYFFILRRNKTEGKKFRKNRSRMQMSLLIGIIGILLLISLVSSFGVTSDYSSENRASVGAGETRTIDILRLINRGSDSINVEVVLVDGAGVASYDGEREITLAAGDSKNIPVKITIPKDATEGTKYDLVFRFIDNTPSSEGGMVNFQKASTNVLAVYVKKPEDSIVASEKPALDNSRYIILLMIVLIISIVIAVYFLLKKKVNKSKRKSRRD